MSAAMASQDDGSHRNMQQPIFKMDVNSIDGNLGFGIGEQAKSQKEAKNKSSEEGVMSDENVANSLGQVYPACLIHIE